MKCFRKIEARTRRIEISSKMSTTSFAFSRLLSLVGIALHEYRDQRRECNGQLKQTLKSLSSQEVQYNPKSRVCSEVLAEHDALLARPGGRYGFERPLVFLLPGTAYHDVSYVPVISTGRHKLLMVYVASTLLISVLSDYHYAWLVQAFCACQNILGFPLLFTNL